MRDQAGFALGVLRHLAKHDDFEKLPSWIQANVIGAINRLQPVLDPDDIPDTSYNATKEGVLETSKKLCDAVDAYLEARERHGYQYFLTREAGRAMREQSRRTRTVLTSPENGRTGTAVELALRDICELSPAMDENPNAVQVDIEDVRVILERRYCIAV